MIADRPGIVPGANILRSIVFGTQARSVAAEINDGTFSAYLVKPVHHLLFMFFRGLAQRCLHTLTAIGEAAVDEVVRKIFQDRPGTNAR